MTQVGIYRGRPGARGTRSEEAHAKKPPFGRREIAIALSLSRDRQVRLLNGRLIFDMNISIKGYPGEELVIAIGPPGNPHTYQYRVRTYFVDNRQYMMSVIGREKLVLPPRSVDYFESFALIKPGEGAAK